MPIAADPARDLSWPSCFNARDLGGYATVEGRRTRWRAVLRADNLCRLTPRGAETVIEDGVVTVVDLRSPFELRIDPCPFAPPCAFPGAPAYRNLPVLDQEDKGLARELDACDSAGAMYALLLQRCRGRFASVVAAVAEAPDGGVLVYCHAGLDRTGLAAALLLAAVGVLTDTIADDYALSEHGLALYEQRRAGVEDPVRRAAFTPPTAPRAAMIAAMDFLDVTHGGAVPYLRSAGVAEAALARLRERFLD